MKQRIYVDTSVLGGIFDDEFKEWSIRLLEEFRMGKSILVLSDITLQELEGAPDKFMSSYLRYLKEILKN